MFKTGNFASFEQDACDAVTWLGEVVGKERVQKSRYGLYLQALDSFFSNSSIDPEVSEKFVIAFEELSCLVSVFRVFKDDTESMGLVNRLEKSFAGHYSRSGDNGGARNILFELSVAAFFHERGCQVKLCEGNDDSDLEVILRDKVFCVECKRPKSSNGIRQNVAKANKQLRNRCGESREKFGLMAFSATLVINPSHGMLEIPVESEIQRIVQGKHKVFLGMVAKELSALKSGGRLLRKNQGCISHADCFVSLGESAVPVYASDIAIFPNWPLDDEITDLAIAMGLLQRSNLY